MGLKAHIGVDAASGLVHSVIGTAGNVSDFTQVHALRHGGEVAAMGDAGYQCVEKREENLGEGVTWQVTMKHAKRKELPYNKLGRMMESLNCDNDVILSDSCVVRASSEEYLLGIPDERDQ